MGTPALQRGNQIDYHLLNWHQDCFAVPILEKTTPLLKFLTCWCTKGGHLLVGLVLAKS